MVIAAGGTGGHISPALAIAEHTVRRDPKCHVEFACGKRPVEVEVYRKAGINPTIFPVEPLARGPIALLKSVWRLRRAIVEARKYVRRD
ncbi:glycosyltransferase, partial [Candidatus Sumerlaeota bacterium]|nr:glycosyltransferase [Candidatus Sumerlaeota bacterium]